MHNKQHAFIHITQDGYYYSVFGSEREESNITTKTFPSNALHGSKHGSWMVGELLDTVRMLDRTLTKFIPNEVLTRSKIHRIDNVSQHAYISLRK